eukprot:8611497-Alexandrium_andersonii.AAC.1
MWPWSAVARMCSRTVSNTFLNIVFGCSRASCRMRALCITGCISDGCDNRISDSGDRCLQEWAGLPPYVRQARS